MKLRDLLWFSKKEFATCPWLYAGLALLLVFALSSIGMTVETFNRAVNAFYDYFNDLTGDEFWVELNGIQAEHKHLVDDVGFSEVYAEGWDNPELFSGDRKIDTYDYPVELYYPRKESDFSKYLEIGSAERKNNVLVSDRLVEDYGIKIGDKLVQKVSKQTDVVYTVTGFFHKEYKDYDIVFSLETYVNNLADRGVFCQNNLVGILDDARNYIRIRRELRQRLIIAYCEYDDVFEVMAVADVIIYALSAITTVFGVWMFNNALGIMVRRRTLYLLKLRMIGIRTSSLIKIFCITTAATILLSCLISYGVVMIFSSYIGGLIKEFYAVGMNNSGSAKSILIILTACIVIYLCGVLKLKRTIGHANLHQELEGSRA